jgi:hypothetical protein
MTMTPAGSVPADWYPNPNDASQLRYWDGAAWTEHYAAAPSAAPIYQQQAYQREPQQQFHSTGPMTSASLNVHRDVMYTRPQQGHSLILWVVLSLFLFFPVIGLIYYSASPNHYWHA